MLTHPKQPKKTTTSGPEPGFSAPRTWVWARCGHFGGCWGPYWGPPFWKLPYGVLGFKPLGCRVSGFYYTILKIIPKDSTVSGTMRAWFLPLPRARVCTMPMGRGNWYSEHSIGKGAGKHAPGTDEMNIPPCCYITDGGSDKDPPPLLEDHVGLSRNVKVKSWTLS